MVKRSERWVKLLLQWFLLEMIVKIWKREVASKEGRDHNCIVKIVFRWQQHEQGLGGGGGVKMWARTCYKVWWDNYNLVMPSKKGIHGMYALITSCTIEEKKDYTKRPLALVMI